MLTLQHHASDFSHTVRRKVTRPSDLFIGLLLSRQRAVESSSQVDCLLLCRDNVRVRVFLDMKTKPPENARQVRDGIPPRHRC